MWLGRLSSLTFARLQISNELILIALDDKDMVQVILRIPIRPKYKNLARFHRLNFEVRHTAFDLDYVGIEDK